MNLASATSKSQVISESAFASTNKEDGAGATNFIPCNCGKPHTIFLVSPRLSGVSSASGGRSYREEQFLCMCTSFSKNNTISAAFKVLMPIFLFWRNSTPFLAFHLHPDAPGWDIKVWHAFGHALRLQSHRHTWRACATVGNGKDPNVWICLPEPSDKLALLFVLSRDSVHSLVSTL